MNPSQNQNHRDLDPQQLNQIYSAILKSENSFRQNHRESKQLAIQQIQKSRQKLISLKQRQFRRGLSLQHKSIKKPSYQITYKYNLANLYYQLYHYQEAFLLYENLYRKNYVVGTEILKAMGDCLRHLNNYEAAKKYYRIGLELNKAQSHQFAYCLGLLSLAEGEYEEAINNFEKAKQMSNQTKILYFYGAATAYLCHECMFIAHQTMEIVEQRYKDIEKVLQQNLGVSKQNISFIRFIIKVFFNNFRQLFMLYQSNKSLLKQKLKNNVQVLFHQIQTNIKYPNEGFDYMPYIEIFSLNENQVLSKINSQTNPKLKTIYEVMTGLFKNQYYESTRLLTDRFQLSQQKINSSIIKNIKSLLPIVIKLPEDSKEIQYNQIKVRAKKIYKLVISEVDLLRLAQASILGFISDNFQILIGFNPQRVVTSWIQQLKLPSFATEQAQIIQTLKDLMAEDSIKVYGMKMIVDLSERFIVTGKIYHEIQGMPNIIETKIHYLRSKLALILKQDLKFNQPMEIKGKDKE